MVLQHLHSGTSMPSGGVHPNEVRKRGSGAERQIVGPLRPQCVQPIPKRSPRQRLDSAPCCRFSHDRGGSERRRLPVAVDYRCFRAPKRVRFVILSRKADADHPLVYEAGILPRAYVGHVVVSAREDEVVQRPAASLQPCPHRLSCRIHQLELHRTFGLLLNHNGAVTDAPAGNYVADPHLDHITAAQLAVDGEVEQRSVAQSPMLVEPEPNGPDLLLFQRPLRTGKPALVPGSKFVKGGVHRRVTHRSSPSGRIGQSRVRRPAKTGVRKCG